jgi:hypothetical protein
MSSAIISTSEGLASRTHGSLADSTSEGRCSTTLREAHREKTCFGYPLRENGGESTGRGRIGRRDRGVRDPMSDALPLHILQLLLGHPKIVPQFMYESLANLMTHFGLA